MKSKLFRNILALMAASVVFSAVPGLAAYTISVETFGDSSGYSAPVYSIMEMMTTELTNSGLFQVVERARLDVIAREQRLAQSGLMDSRTAPQTGRLAGAQYMMTGAITNYSFSRAGGGGVVGRGRGLTGIAVGSNTAYVTLDVRIVDTTTGAIVYAGRAEGAASNVSGGLVSRYGGFGTSRSGGLLASATHKAITKVVDALRASVGAGVAPGSAEELHVLENRGPRNITIDAGSSNAGARRGKYYAVYRESGVVRDIRGNILDSERYYLAVIQVTDAHPQYSRCKVIRGGGFTRGDFVEPISRPDSVRLSYSDY
ncbi:MAG: CsgG/HfaB family protein [Pyramidobacter sp.]|nr:CsgG/HfaB family protein [Pyramidobacter sp.]